MSLARALQVMKKSPQQLQAMHGWLHSGQWRVWEQGDTTLQVLTLVGTILLACFVMKTSPHHSDELHRRCDVMGRHSG